jgi:hypothetical protein
LDAKGLHGQLNQPSCSIWQGGMSMLCVSFHYRTDEYKFACCVLLRKSFTCDDALYTRMNTLFCPSYF